MQCKILVRVKKKKLSYHYLGLDRRQQKLSNFTTKKWNTLEIIITAENCSKYEIRKFYQ